MVWLVRGAVADVRWLLKLLRVVVPVSCNEFVGFSIAGGCDIGGGVAGEHRF